MLNLVAAVAVFLGGYAIGMRGDALFAAGLLALLPMQFILTLVTIRLFPPDVATTGEIRGILYGTPPEPDPRPEPEIATEAARGLSTHTTAVSEGRRIFASAKTPWTLEGLVLAGTSLLLVFWMAWTAARPWVYQVLPTLGATGTGPPSFPVTVQIGEQEISFTNGSAVAWNCMAVLGTRETFTASFPLEAQQMREVSYVDFRGAGAFTRPDAARQGARTLVTIACTEPSGQGHSWRFE